MPQDPAAALSALLRSASIQDHEEVLRAANAALKANKADITAQHTRVVALLHLDRFDDALRAIGEGGNKLENACLLERVYALYKTGKLDDATAVLKSVGLEERSVSHVAAQVAYRAERFDGVHAIYQKLSSEDAADEKNDLNINSKAATAQAEWQGINPSQPADDDEQPDAFEVCFNIACSCIARGALEQASSLLQRAARLCDASDDLSDEDKEAEMQPILAQQAYVYARLGKTKEAVDLYNSLAQSDTIDPDLALVLENNLSALNTDRENPFLLQRKASTWSARSKDAKFFNYQTEALNRNSLIIDLKAQKIDGISRRTAKALYKTHHPSPNPAVNALSVLNAVAATHGTSGKQLTRAVQELSRKRPDDVGLVLTVVQNQLRQENHGAALSTLEAFLSRLGQSEDVQTTDVRFSPGLVALAVSLMRHQGREASAKAELAKAATYWQDRPSGSSTSLLREAGIELLRSSKPQDLQLAGSAFEKLFARNQGSHIAAAGLVASLAPSDPQKAEKYVAELPEVDDLIGGIDVEQLIDAGVAAPPKSTATLKRPAPDDGDRKAASKKRRKRKLPKNYVEGRTPDPERWLPLRDRSSYRPKGKKGKKKMAESTQGGIVREEETLELVGGGGVKVERAPASGSSNKKKKKGKK